MKQLRNGARPVCRVETATRIFVLAEVSSTSAPWVTWEVDTDGNAYYGHYFSTRNEAVADLIGRAFV